MFCLVLSRPKIPDDIDMDQLCWLPAFLIQDRYNTSENSVRKMPNNGS
jgi:hypothetical protein